MRNFILIALLLVTAGLTAQVRPDQFVEETNPNDSNFEVYSQKGGINRRAGLASLRKYFGAEIVTGAAPAASGNAENLRNKIILVLPDSITYFVDWSGDAVKLGGVEGNMNVYELSAVSDTSTITQPNEGELALVPDTLLIRSETKWLLFQGGDDWGTQTVQSDGTLTGNGTTGSPLAVNRDTFPDRSDVTQEIADTATVLRDSLTDLRSALDAVAADLAAQQDSMSNKVIASLTNNRVPVATGARTLGNSYLLQDPTGVTLDAQRYFRQTGGTTLQRPAGSEGMEWYNTTTSQKEIYAGGSWKTVLSAAFPAGELVYGSGGGLASTSLATYNTFTNSLEFRKTSSTSPSLYFNNTTTGATLQFYSDSGNFKIKGNDLWIENPVLRMRPATNMTFDGGVFIRTANSRNAITFSEINTTATRIAQVNISETTFGESPFGITTPVVIALPVRMQGKLSGVEGVGTYIFQNIRADSANHILTALRLSPTFNQNAQTGIVARGIRYNPTTPAATHYAATFSSGFVGIGTEVPTQSIHTTGNIRNEGAYYDSNNDPGTAGQHLQSTASGADWVSEHLGFNRYTSDPDTLNPSQGTVYELDSEAGASGWTQQIKATNLPAGGSFSVLINTTTGRDITFDSVSGDFYYNTLEGSASSTLVFSGISVKYLKFIWTGTAWLVIDLK